MRPMRRSDRAVTDPEKIEEIIKACACMRLGFSDGGEVYIVPLSFGYVREGGRYRFYFHGASEGRKAELIRGCPRVGFEADAGARVYGEGENGCAYSTSFVSVIGAGRVEPVTDAAEKLDALRAIMRHSAGERDWRFEGEWLDKVFVFRLDADELSAKEHK